MALQQQPKADLSSAPDRSFQATLGTKEHGLLRYVFAGLVALAALGCQYAISPITGAAQFILLFPATLLSAWLWGVGPALVAIVTCVLGVDFMFLGSPKFSLFTGQTVAEWLRLAIFGSATIAMASFIAKGKARLKATIQALEESQKNVQKARDDLERANAELEQRVQERTLALTSANKELEAFCYSVSHDLRAPLRGIDGFSQVLITNYAANLDDQGKGYLERVRAATQRMGHLIDDLLKLSRLTRVEMRRERVDLSALARRTFHELRAANPDRQVELRIDEGLSTTGDTTLLSAVLENLLGNAWKFTAKVPKAKIEVGKLFQDGVEIFFVRDNGAGFNMDYSQQLFGAFQRLHKPTEFPGTGVGLASVRRIIHRHNGEVWAQSEVGKGATFYFTVGHQRPQSFVPAA